MRNNNEVDNNNNSQNNESNNLNNLSPLSNQLYYQYDSEEYNDPDSLFYIPQDYSSDEEELDGVFDNEQLNNSDANLAILYGMFQNIQQNLNLSQPVENNNQTPIEDVAGKNARDKFLQML